MDFPGQEFQQDEKDLTEEELTKESKHRGKIVYNAVEYDSIQSLAKNLSDNNSQTTRSIARKIYLALDDGETLQEAIDFALLNPSKVQIKYKGIMYESIRDLSKEIGINYSTLSEIVRKDWPEKYWDAEKLPTSAPDFYYCIDNPEDLIDHSAYN